MTTIKTLQSPVRYAFQLSIVTTSITILSTRHSVVHAEVRADEEAPGHRQRRELLPADLEPGLGVCPHAHPDTGI